MDRDTDLPIAGAFVSRQMLGTSRNPLYNIGGTTGPTPLLQFAFQDTDRLGHFSFSKDNTIMKWSESGDPLIYLYGPDIRQAIQIIVYSPEYIPVRSHQAGFVWTKEEWLSLDQEQTQDMRNPKWKVVGPSGFSAERTGSLRTGYQYRIEMVKAVTEAQWQEKCHETWLLNNLYIPKKVSDKWMFTDLTGYLESWPGGEKAGEYLHLLLNAVAVGCDGSNADTTMRELSEGDGGRREVIGVVERNQAILRLASRHGAVISAEDAARVC